MATFAHKLFRIVFPEQPVDLLERPELISASDFESVC
jgi:hypothetical protein